MSENLYFLINKFQSQGALHATWFLVDKNEGGKDARDSGRIKILEKSGNFDDFFADYNAQHSERNIIILIDGSFLTYKIVPAAVKNRRQMLQALPFLVEEQIITNIDDMHLSISDNWEGGYIRAVLLDRLIVDRVKGIFSAVDIDIDAVYGLPDILAPDDDEIIISISNEYSLIKGITVCMQCENNNLSDIFKLIDLNNIKIISFYINTAVNNGKLLVEQMKNTLLQHPQINAEIVNIKGDSVGYFLLNHMDSANKINIIKKDFSMTYGEWYSIAFWKPLLYTLIISSFFLIGFNFSAGVYFKHLSNTATAIAINHYLQKFPSETKVVDVKAQVEGKLKSLQISGNPGNFSKIFGVAAESIIKIGNKKDITLRQLRYDEQSGEIKIDMDVTTIALLDNLKKEIIQRGLQAEIVSANQSNQVIKAVLLIKVD